MRDYLSVIENEARFHDHAAAKACPTDELAQEYSCFDSPAPYAALYCPRLKARLRTVLGNVSGKRILVYGCGTDPAPLWFARSGAVVDAIDISPESVRRQELLAQATGLRFRALVRDAHHTDLPPSQYDLVYGNAVLHHLDLSLAARETHRLLKPGGMAVFRDVMRGHLFLRMFRRLTPFWRTPDEHPLTDHDLGLLAERFASADVDHYYLTALPYSFFRRMMNNVVLPRTRMKIRIPHFPVFYATCDRIDCLLFGLLPLLKKSAWLCLVTLRKG